MTDAEPPYRRIVTEIARRIAEGDLAPGDRVPSTRQIARDWGVALATATKALTLLHQQGLVIAQPRVGTVVAPAKRPRSAPTGEHGLTRDAVITTAISIADSEGLNAVSMRRVATELGAATMSTYRYVQSKDDLILMMADVAFGEVSYPDSPPVGWRAQVELGARQLWIVHRKHPWLAHINPLGRPLTLPGLAVHAEWLLNGLAELELDPTTTMNVNILLYSHVQGMAVNLEQEAQAQAATGLTADEWVDATSPDREALIKSGRFPAFARLLESFDPDGYDFDLDILFELGLQSLLDGLALRYSVGSDARL